MSATNHYRYTDRINSSQPLKRWRCQAAGMLLGGFFYFAQAAATAQQPEAARRWLDGLPVSQVTEVSVSPPPAFAQVSRVEAQGAGTTARAQTPTVWTTLTLDLIAKYRLNPLRAARVLAYVHAAMDDAYTAVELRADGEPARVAAAYRAASAVLDYLFPEEAPGWIEVSGLMKISTLIADGGLTREQAIKAWLIGNRVFQAAVVRARHDRADASWDPAQRPRAAPSIWRPTPPIFSFVPTEPVAGSWKTWAVKDVLAFQPPPPIAYGSRAYRAEVDQVRKVQARLTAEHKRIADAWNLEQGTVTPPGVWNRIFLPMAAEEKLATGAVLRALAALNAGMHDALVAAWQAKFRWWSVRPVSVIRDKFDKRFTPYLQTPPFPSYPSGHASVSGAAAVILAAVLPGRAAEFDAMAREAAVSRLYGGIHFPHDNDRGLDAGRKLGAEVVRTRLTVSVAAQP